MAYINKLTNQGKDALADIQTGLTLTFTRIGLSEIEYDEADMEGLTPANFDVLIYGSIAGVARDRPAHVTVTSKLRQAEVPREFELWALGVFATVDNGPEILYTICISIDTPDIVFPVSPQSIIEHTFKIATVIDNAPNVTAIFDPDLNFINIGLPAAGAGPYHSRLGNEVRFRRIAGDGQTITVSENPDTISIRTIPIVPVGAIMPYAGPASPAGWLTCIGQAISRVDYNALFGVVGVMYGAGNGATTFNLPDCRSRLIVGAGQSPGLSDRPLTATAGTEGEVLTQAQLAFHDHTFLDQNHRHEMIDLQHEHGTETLHWTFQPTIDPEYPSPPPYTRYWIRNYANERVAVSERRGSNVAVNLAGSNIRFAGQGGNQAHNNMPPYISLNYIIKF
jgi:microcystin-dependent protein